jgi:uncharacterized protein YndB with AHSA1/START domain
MIWKSVIAVIFILGLVIFVATQVQSTAHVVHILRAPVEKAWPYWADAELIKKYWGPKDWHSPLVQHDFQVGGKFILGMQPDKGGDAAYNAGVYKEIIPNQKIVAEMSFSDANGNVLKGKDIPVPGKWPDIITVTFEFKDLGNGTTEVTVTEVGIPLIMKLFAQMGWKQQFEKLDQLLK